MMINVNTTNKNTSLLSSTITKMVLFAATTIVATSFLPSSSIAVDAAGVLKAGDNICVEGYAMDFFCISRGTLLDNPSVRTLENPEEHSIHCLVDVDSCVTSPFEILLDPLEPGQLYNRGWRLDEESKTKAIELAHNVGSCDTCVDNDISHQKGFRVVMNATILNLNTDDSSIPPTLQVHSMEDTTAFVGSSTDNGIDSACMTYFGIQDIVDKAAEAAAAAESSGCAGSSSGSSFFGGIAVDSNSAGTNGRNKIMKMYLAHGSLMMIGWGLLLPSGTIIAKFFKHRPNGLWFKIHRGIQVLGLLLALIAWIIALSQFSVFGDKGFVSYQHGICGMVVMILGILQPLNAFFRPHAPKDGVDKTTTRKIWEFWHKGSGWFAVLLAIPTIALGTLSLPDLDLQKKFQIGYGAGCGGFLLLLIAYVFYDKMTFKQEEEVVADDGQGAAANNDGQESAVAKSDA